MILTNFISSSLLPNHSAPKIDAFGKRQKGSRGRGTMGFKLISDSTGYYFLYLDNLKNLRLAEDHTPAKYVDGLGGRCLKARWIITETYPKYWYLVRGTKI